MLAQGVLCGPGMSPSARQRVRNVAALAIAASLLSLSSRAQATPSTTVSAPATPALQGFAVLHLTYDTSFASEGLYPVDLGLTMGILPWKELQLEVGVDSEGEEAQVGVLASDVSPAIDLPRIDKMVVAADVRTGNNALGAVGGGVSIYFTPALALLTGPVFFLEPEVKPGASDWMWSAQLDVDIDFTGHAR